MKNTEANNGGLHEQEPATSDKSNSSDGGPGTGRDNAGRSGAKNGDERNTGNGRAGESPDCRMGGESGNGGRKVETDSDTGSDICEGGGELRAGEVENNENGSLLPQQLMVTEAFAIKLNTVKNMFGYDGPTDENGILQYINECDQQINYHVFRQGAALIYYKEFLGHGNWLDGLEKLEMEARYAQQIMRACLRLGHMFKAGKLSKFSKCRLLELAYLDNEPLKELEETGSVLNVELSEYQKMPIREMRKRIKETNETFRKQEESYERLLKKEQEEKQKYLDEIDALKKAKPRHRWSEEAKNVLSDIQVLYGEILERTGRAFDLADRVQELKESEFSTGQFAAMKFLQSFSEMLDGFNVDLMDKIRSINPDYKPGLEGSDVFSDDFIAHEKLSYGNPLSQADNIDFDDVDTEGIE